MDTEHWEIMPDVKCTHGNLDRLLPSRAVLTNSTTRGPDCEITFRKKKGPEEGTLVTIKFQQNLCVLEAGDITVTQKLGPEPKQMKCTKGSYADGKSGVCLINF